MNWRNVLLLIKADVKSYRIIRGEKFRRFRESRLFDCILYLGSSFIGAAMGYLIGTFYNALLDASLREMIFQGFVNLLISLPALALLYGLIFTQIGQFQRMGVKLTIQPLYWLPITWEEHTLASILANLIGLSSAITLFICVMVAVASLYLGSLSLALLTIFSLIVSVFIASATTEILKTLQVRISGALTKFAGRFTIWVRLIVFIASFIAFYTAYFYVYYRADPLTLLKMVASGQRTLWFIPYIWPGLALTYFASGESLGSAVFLFASIFFSYLLFLVATKLNSRFILYEEPAIKISRVYIPKAGMLEKLGILPSEAALIRKDFKALTRRKELMYIFIAPIVLAIMPIIMHLSKYGPNYPPEFAAFLFTWLTLFPGAVMAMSLGCRILGLEGKPVWYIHSSPISAQNLVRAKYVFTILFSMAVMLICFIAGFLLTSPSAKLVITCLAESLLLIPSLSMVSLSFGIKGADFREVPKPRMIKPIWALVNMVVCTLLSLAVVSPIIPHALRSFFGSLKLPNITIPSIPELYLYAALLLSSLIAFVIIKVFYGIALRNAEEFLVKGEAIY